jgi:hypothetical protein
MVPGRINRAIRALIEPGSAVFGGRDDPVFCDAFATFCDVNIGFPHNNWLFSDTTANIFLKI